MIKNEYTDRINEIKAPQSAVENAVKAALEADKNKKEVITMPKKSKIIKIVSAAAACALVVTGVAVASNMNSPKPIIHDNSAPSQTETSVAKSFSLIVNAAELTEENTVGISELNMSGVNCMGVEAMSIELVKIDENTSKYRAIWYPTINFPVVCRGSGIESITYKINNALFVPDKNSQLIEEKSEKSIPLSEYYDGIEWNDIKNTYKSLTISYDEQLKSDSVAYIALKPTSELDIDEDDEFAKRALDYLENIPSFDEFVDFKNGDKYLEWSSALLKAEIKDVTVDIIVNFADGTNTTQTIAFIGKYDEIDGSTMPIEITFVSELSPEEKAVVKGSSEYQPPKLTLEKTKEIIEEALKEAQEIIDKAEEQDGSKPTIDDYTNTVSECIKSKIDEIQYPTTHITNIEGGGYYTSNDYYALDSDTFEDCHKAIAISETVDYIVYEEYDDDHNIIQSEVLYDMTDYMEN